MALTEYKITASKLAQKGVCAAPDVLTGTPVENKAVFDRVVRELVATAVNEVIDYMAVVEQAEQTRGSAENERAAAEEQRAEAESARDAAYLWHTNDEVARQSAEQARAQAEQARIQAEGERARAESERATADLWRGNDEVARQSAEQARVQAEQTRVQAESERARAESERATADLWRGNDEVARQGAEEGRVRAEQARVRAESERATADLWRGNDEVARQGAEEGRVRAEQARVQAESTRVSVENNRISAEQARVQAEQSRVSAESARNLWEVFDAAHTYRAGNKVTYHGSSYVCRATCTAVLPTDATYWMLIAQKGVDGTGAGDMRAEWYDPTGQERDVFAHERSVSNPHQVTKAQVGLGEVDNTADLDKPISTATQSALSNLQSEVSDLAGYVGYTDADIYGVEVDFVNKRCTRLAGAVGKMAGADFDNLAPWDRKRCIVSDDGEVLAYCGEMGYTESGALTQDITIGEMEYPIGTKVQVMVEQPIFYMKAVPVEAKDATSGKGKQYVKGRFYISPTPKSGFSIPRAFYDMYGIPQDKIYLSAYEGSIYDTSAAAQLLADEQVASFDEDKLCSIAGAKPASGLTQNLTRANVRKLCNNRGTGWQSHNIFAMAITEWLFMVEHASLDPQRKVGQGVSTFTDDGTTNMAVITGATAGIGNGSGIPDGGENGKCSVTYRGEENLWGNIWTWLDCINILANGVNEVWVAKNGTAPVDNTTEGYECLDAHASHSNGYISSFGIDPQHPEILIPTEAIGSDTFADFVYQNYTYSGFCITMLGGSLSHGSRCGFSLILSYASSAHNRGIGGRLLYVPQTKVSAV